MSSASCAVRESTHCDRACKQGAPDGYPHHLIGALPGSFNYATLSDSAAARGAAGSPSFAASQVPS